MLHCVKSARIRSYSGPHFSRNFPAFSGIRTEYSYLSVFGPNAEKCGKNVDQNNTEYGLFLRSACNPFISKLPKVETKTRSNFYDI